jgi:hypothetical protein
VVLAAGAAVNDIFTALAYNSATQITQGNTKVEVTDSGTGKIEFTVDAVEVADFTTGEVVFNETGANQDFRVEGDTNANLLIADAGVDKVGFGTNTFNTNGGVIQVSNGISFPATQSACSDVNTLDDYEEGTWTPTVIGSTTPGTVAYAGRVGKYTKIGNVVTFTLYLNWSAGTGTGNLQISGLPFTVAGGTHIPAVTIGKFSFLTLTADNVVTAYCNQSANIITIEQYPVGGGTPSFVAYDDTVGDTFISGSYQV